MQWFYQPPAPKFSKLARVTFLLQISVLPIGIIVPASKGMNMFRILVVQLICFMATAAFASEEVDMQTCSTSVKGKPVTLEYDINGHWSGPNPWLYDNYTFREILLAGWGDIDCPSAITMVEFAPEFSPAERSELCLFWDTEEKTFTGFGEGNKNAYGICEDTKTVCQRVGDAKAVVSDFADSAAGTAGALLAGAAGAATGASTVAGAAGVSAVAHSSGAAILTGSSGYVAGSLGSLGATALAGSGAVAAVITAPVTLTIAGVSAAAVGGAAYFCWDEL